MKRPTSVVVLTLLGCATGAGAVQEFDGAQAFAYVETQVGFGPRVPNTDGHRSGGDWILERLRGTADSVEVQAFAHVTLQGDTLQLRNFIARFRPDLTDRVLYVAHWDTRPRADQDPNLGAQRMPVLGANDGASGVAVLLAVADALAADPPRFGVDLVFVDGEDYGDFSQERDVLVGSRYYAEQLSPQDRKPLFAVVWDMVGDRDLRIPQEGNSVDRAPEVVQRVWSKARELGYRRQFPSEVGSWMTDDHIPLQQSGVRAIVVIDFTYEPWHTGNDTLDKVSAASLQIVGDVALALLR
jgi:hypothetical protein